MSARASADRLELAGAAAEADLRRDWWRLLQLAAGSALLVAAILHQGSAYLTLTAVVLAIFLPAERLLAANPVGLLRRRGLLTDVTHWFATSACLNIALVGITAAIAWLLHGVAGTGVQNAISHQPVAVQLVEAIAITYLCVYWTHRTIHRVPLLWRFHVVHHSPEDVDWLTATRFHPIDLVLMKSTAYIPLYALGFSKTVLGTYLVFEGLQAIFVHANVRVPIGPLRWLIATPEFHRWHHANVPEAIDKNFCELPLLDLLFGTAYMPREGRPEVFGVDEPTPSAYIGQILHPFLPRPQAS